MDLRGTTLKELISGSFDSQAVSDYFVKRIKNHNPMLNVYLQVRPKTGRTSQKSFPIALKDNILTKDFFTTASSKVLEGFTPPYNATITHKLIEAGATILGKTNLDAWAHGSSTETSDFGSTRNPYKTDYVPGGSSGGSAAAVAAGLAPAALGTETAGSIRLPAAWSGVVGLKPTYGRVSRYGIVAMGSSWDCPGPVTQTVEDAAMLLEIISGKDPHDATTLDAPVDSYSDALTRDRTYTIGVAEEYFANVDPEIAARVRECISILEKRGHTIKKISLMDPTYAISVYMLLQRSEVSSNLGRYDGIRYGQDRTHFGAEARRRIMLGTYALSSGYYDAYYKKAQKVRYVIREDFKKVFSEVDVIIAPTTPITATKIGDIDKYAFYGEMMDVLTEPASAAGIPAISIPCGLHSNGLPMGVQFMGRHLEESTILHVAHELESELKFDRLAVMKNYE